MPLLRRALPLCALGLLACGEKDGSTDSTPADSDPGTHPLVPDGYEFRWDTDGCGDTNEDTQVYILGEATTTGNGTVTASERWFWFFGGAWEDDCMDGISYSGSAVSQGTLNSLDASQAEEGYDAQMTKSEDGCPQMNYLYLWDHPDKEDFEYGDTLDQRVILIFDTLSPSGNLNYENAMLVFMGYEMQSNTFSMDIDYARGVFTPRLRGRARPAGQPHAEASMPGGRCLEQMPRSASAEPRTPPDARAWLALGAAVACSPLRAFAAGGGAEEGASRRSSSPSAPSPSPTSSRTSWWSGCRSAFLHDGL
ncbi:MAG: hypothetical protein H6740_28385 [Alphaproteobacteria bacterium]|nr:hypothetical protein [Alphaproteobacteria bacterium]